MNHGDPLIAGDPGGVGCQDLSSHLPSRVSLLHQGEIVLVLDHAGQQGVVTLHLHHRCGQTVTEGGS